MLEISRRVRFCVSPTVDEATQSGMGRFNTFAGWPTMLGIGAYYELIVRCRGEADPSSGFIANISVLDKAVREQALPVISRVVRERTSVSPGQVLRDVLPKLQEALHGTVGSLTWKLTPFYGVTMETRTMDRVEISQVFEFAAAHRLHNPDLSDEENLRVYGKCNNPHGHGHNYQLEVVVARPVDESPKSPVIGLPELERIVNERVVNRFDHTHLNLDTAEFARAFSSVEQIAKVCFDLLQTPIERAGGELIRVTVWETEKTSCTYQPG